MQRKTPQISLWLRRKETELEGLSPPWSKSQSCTNDTWKWSRSVVSDSLRPCGCSPPGSSVHGILQERILEWVAISFYRGSFWPRDQTWVSCIAGRCFTLWATRDSHNHVLDYQIQYQVLPWNFSAKICICNLHFFSFFIWSYGFLY